MATDEVLYTGTVKNIVALIAGCGFPNDAFFLAEQVPLHIVEGRAAREDLLRFACVRDLKLNNEKKDGIDPAFYTTGRIFAKDFELRWHQNVETGKTRVVYLGPQRDLPGLELDADPQESDADPQQKMKDKLKEKLAKLHRKEESKKYYLFGEPLDNDRLAWLGLEEERKKLGEDERYYAELRIPRLLRYPTVSKQRVQLTVCEYIEEETGRVQLYRFQKLEAVEEKA